MKIINFTNGIVCGVLFLLVSLSSQASGKFDGVRLGLAAGGDFGKTRAQTLGSASTLPNITTVSNATDLGFQGVLGGLFVGYGKTLNGIYLGGEASAEIHSAKSENTNNAVMGSQLTTLFSIKKKYTISAELKIGKEVRDNLLLYIKGGIAWPNYRLASSVIINGAGVISTTATNNKGLAQFTAGIGIEHLIAPISQNIDLIGGAEYQHAFARNINLALNSSIFNGTTKFKPSLDVLKVKLSLRF